MQIKITQVRPEAEVGFWNRGQVSSWPPLREITNSKNHNYLLGFLLFYQWFRDFVSRELFFSI
jgi:hypothetical protein